MRLDGYVDLPGIANDTGTWGNGTELPIRRHLSISVWLSCEPGEDGGAVNYKSGGLDRNRLGVGVGLLSRVHPEV